MAASIQTCTPASSLRASAAREGGLVAPSSLRVSAPLQSRKAQRPVGARASASATPPQANAVSVSAPAPSGTGTGKEFAIQAFTNWLLLQEREGVIDNEMTVVLSSISLACKQIASLVQRAGISNLTGVQGAQNVQGEDQKKLDVVSNEVSLSPPRFNLPLAELHCG